MKGYNMLRTGNEEVRKNMGQGNKYTRKLRSKFPWSKKECFLLLRADQTFK